MGLPVIAIAEAITEILSGRSGLIRVFVDTSAMTGSNEYTM
jgi:hypothetical protein